MIQEIPELDFVSSTSKTGVSIVMVNVREEFMEMRPIWDDLRRKVDRVRPELPADIVGPTVDDEFGDVFGVIVTLAGEAFSYAELKDIADEVRDELLRVTDVAKVEIHGAQEERVFVDYDNARLAELELSPIQLRQILESANIIISGGEVHTGVERIMLEPSGNFESVDDLRQAVVSLPGRPEILYLEDLATISRGYVDPPTTMVLTSGTPALALVISMRDGGNLITLGARIRRELERLQAVYPIGIDLCRGVPDPPTTMVLTSGTPALALVISMRDGGNLITLGARIRRELERLQAVYPIGIDFDVVAFQPDIVDRKVDEFVMNLL